MSNFQYKDKKIEEHLKEVGRILKENMPPGYGFTLLMFNYGPDGGMFYLSSAQRTDMIQAMKEFIQKQGDD